MPQGGCLVLRLHVVNEDFPCQAELDATGRNRTPSEVRVTDNRMSFGDETSHGGSIRNVMAEVEVGGLDEKKENGMNLG